MISVEPTAALSISIFLSKGNWKISTTPLCWSWFFWFDWNIIFDIDTRVYRRQTHRAACPLKENGNVRLSFLSITARPLDWITSSPKRAPPTPFPTTTPHTFHITVDSLWHIFIFYFSTQSVWTYSFLPLQFLFSTLSSNRMVKTSIWLIGEVHRKRHTRATSRRHQQTTHWFILLAFRFVFRFA